MDKLSVEIGLILGKVSFHGLPCQIQPISLGILVKALLFKDPVIHQKEGETVNRCPKFLNDIRGEGGPPVFHAVEIAEVRVKSETVEEG